MPLSSDQTPLGGPYGRGVRWLDTDFPGYRTLLIHDNTGALVLECRMAEHCADDATLRAAWAWLDQHFPEPATPTEPSYPALRLA